jgi:hypothetical protein
VKISGDWAISRQPRLGGRALRGHTPPTRPVRPRVKRWSRPQRRRSPPEAGESRCGRLIPWFWVRVPGGPYTFRREPPWSSGYDAALSRRRTRVRVPVGVLDPRRGMGTCVRGERALEEARVEGEGASHAAGGRVDRRHPRAAPGRQVDDQPMGPRHPAGRGASTGSRWTRSSAGGARSSGYPARVFEPRPSTARLGRPRAYGDRASTAPHSYVSARRGSSRASTARSRSTRAAPAKRGSTSGSRVVPRRR